MMKEQMSGESVLCGETIAANGETQVMEGASTIGSVSEIESNMTYKPPYGQDAETRGVIPDMEELMADPEILGIAYGPAFEGKGSKKAGDQIIAWRYMPDKELVAMYYPKTTCRGLVESGEAARRQGKPACGDGSGNLAGVGTWLELAGFGKLAGIGTCLACPSCKRSRGSCKLDESKKIPVGNPGGYAIVDLASMLYLDDSMVSSGIIVKIDSGYKIEISDGCYFDHAWVKSVSLKNARTKSAMPDTTPKCKTATGSECSCTFPE